jgi:hypothetical protein
LVGRFQKMWRKIAHSPKDSKPWLLNLIRAMHAVETSQLETLRHGKLS